MFVRRILLCAFAAAIFVPSFGYAEPPPRPFDSFSKAKKVTRDAIYSGHHVDLYCGCAWTPNESGTGGKIDPAECGYQPRKNKARGKVLEWEHIVPAAFFGQGRACWKNGNAKCVKADGKKYKGRACCEKADPTFARIEADLHNLAPTVGELNADRSDRPYGIVAGEKRQYGVCDFEVGGTPKVTEPPDNVKGDVARVWFYMSDTYGVKLTTEQRSMFEAWSNADPVDKWERLRNRRIDAAQGNKNPYIH